MFVSLVKVLVLVAWVRAQTHDIYDQHKVLEIVHKTEEDFRKLLQMELRYELDFWKLPKNVNDTMTVRVSPQHLQSFLLELQQINADVKITIDNVKHLLDASPKKWAGQLFNKRSVSTRSSGMVLDQYHTHNSIRSYINTLAGSLLPSGISASIFSIGQSYEGREVEGIKISSSSGGSNKRGIFIDGGIHAREWVSPASVIYFIEMFAYNPYSNPDIDIVLGMYDLYFLPVVNPDGYEYTQIARLWRKNRRVNSGYTCLGVDLNRNFPFEWAPSVGGSTDPCSDIYSGPNPGSEVETQNLVSYLTQNGAMFDAYLTVHSYGQMWLYPWGYTANLPADWQDLDAAAKDGVDAIRVHVDRTRYERGSSTNVLYSAAGGSDDFAKGGAGVKYSYTLELRDTGRYAFELPTSLIVPTSDEFLYGFLKFAQAMNRIQRSGQ